MANTKDITVSEEMWDFLWDIKRKFKLKSLDKVISTIKEKLPKEFIKDLKK